MKSGSRDDDGFTLVEVLLALALASLLLVAVFDSARVTMEGWRSGMARAADLEEASIVRNIIRRMLSNSYPMYQKNGSDERWTAFDGSTGSVSFLAGSPAVLDDGGLYRMSIAVEQRDSRKDVILSSELELAREGFAKRETTTLLKGVEEFELAYFGLSPSDHSQQWHGSWTKRNEMPTLVRVRWQYPPDDRRRSEELLVSPKIVADQSCVYDPVSRRCKGR